MIVKTVCSAKVNLDAWGHIARCTKNATTTEDGKPYCSVHAPSHVAQRRAKRQAAWDAKDVAERKERDRRTAYATEQLRRAEMFPVLLEALEMLKTHADLFGVFRDDVGQEVLAEVNAAIAQAKEGENMTRKQAQQYFNREARYYEGGLPPDREHRYALRYQGETFTAADTKALMEQFWAYLVMSMQAKP